MPCQKYNLSNGLYLNHIQYLDLLQIWFSSNKLNKKKKSHSMLFCTQPDTLLRCISLLDGTVEEI